MVLPKYFRLLWEKGNDDEFCWWKNIINLGLGCAHWGKTQFLVQKLNLYQNVNFTFKYLHFFLSQSLVFSAKIQISNMASSHQKSNFWTKMELLPKCVASIISGGTGRNQRELGQPLESCLFAALKFIYFLRRLAKLC